jgi:hypothetical protein
MGRWDFFRKRSVGEVAEDAPVVACTRASQKIVLTDRRELPK